MPAALSAEREPARRVGRGSSACAARASGRINGTGGDSDPSGVRGRGCAEAAAAGATAGGFPERQAELRLYSSSPLKKLSVPVQGRPVVGRGEITSAAEPGPGGGAGVSAGPGPGPACARPGSAARAERGEGAAAVPSLLPRTTRVGKLSEQGQSQGERDGGFHSSPAAPRAELPEDWGCRSAGTCRERVSIRASPARGSRAQLSCAG